MAKEKNQAEQLIKSMSKKFLMEPFSKAKKSKDPSEKKEYMTQARDYKNFKKAVIGAKDGDGNAVFIKLGKEAAKMDSQDKGKNFGGAIDKIDAALKQDPALFKKMTNFLKKNPDLAESGIKMFFAKPDLISKSGQMESLASLSKNKGFDEFLERVNEHEGLQKIFFEGGDGSGKALDELTKAAKENPDLFVHMNNFMTNHPGMVDDVANQFLNDPTGAMFTVQMHTMVDLFLTEIAGFSPDLAKFLQPIANTLISLSTAFDGVLGDFQKDIKGFFGPEGEEKKIEGQSSKNGKLTEDIPIKNDNVTITMKNGTVVEMPAKTYETLEEKGLTGHFKSANSTDKTSEPSQDNSDKEIVKEVTQTTDNTANLVPG